MGIKKLIAVIVLYKSSLENSESFKTLKNSLIDFEDELTLVVYNNSPDYWTYNGKAHKRVDIKYIEDNTNSGVGRAYNEAFKIATVLEKDYIILLDQDTTISIDFFDLFLKILNNQQNVKVSLYSPLITNGKKLISPSKFVLFSSQELHYKPNGVVPLKGLAVINSGLIISTSLFKEVGGYNEKIKLDFSDFDFLKRCLAFTQDIFILNTAFHHSLSSEEAVSKQSAVTRFDYYLEGAKHYKKNSAVALGLYTWIFLRSIKLNMKYKTFIFTKKTILSLTKIA
ncbi:glycosyltransferase [Pedobacter jejuensis]|uniref:Glycosyltransferase n=1 Tax=Pedobacter jejuensis TaxID=1268550 RepID=A0A3N0C3I2_9SPHI|nr:glycosyltransferase [Pedobacter jejuensis]RNL56907.1 glycosyltransferase [Pedobacter jejuensis]